MSEYWELKEKGLRKVLTLNSVRCLECGEVLESKNRHHMSMCNCPNETMTDGGNDYQRWGGKDFDKIENLSQYIIMTEQEYQDMLERKRIENERILQEKIEAGLMVNFCGEWINRSTYDLIMSQCLKLADK